MLKSVKDNDFDAFEAINRDIGWAEISADKMKELEVIDAGEMLKNAGVKIKVMN